MFATMKPVQRTIRVAILDLYEGVANEGMRCIREIINQFAEHQEAEVSWDEFEVRQKQETPGLDYDIYISSGGPGSPLESEGTAWENQYFAWIQSVLDWNREASHTEKKHVFFICHSFQLACRFFQLAQVAPRKSTAFGVFPVHMLPSGKQEAVFDQLKDPFYAVDSRDYQVIQPKHTRIREMGARILCIEKERPHVPLERAIMSIRFNDFMIGTQFHPEADAIGMSMYLQRADKKETVIANHGEEKWKSMIEHLNDPDKIMWTNRHLLPNFLQQASEVLCPAF